MWVRQRYKSSIPPLLGSAKTTDISPSRRHKSCLSFCQINQCGVKLSRYGFAALMSPDSHFKGLIGDTRRVFGNLLIRLKKLILVHLQKRLSEKRLHPMRHLWEKTCHWRSRYKSYTCWGSSKSTAALWTRRTNKGEQNNPSVSSAPLLILIDLQTRITKADTGRFFVNRLCDLINNNLKCVCGLLRCILVIYVYLQKMNSTIHQLSLNVKIN